MSINIKNPAAEEALRALIAVTGESQASAVEIAARERLARIRRADRRTRILQDVADLQRKTGGAPLRADDLFDEAGLPR